MTHTERLIALLREHSVKWGDFTLASGKKSDLYVDVRQTSLHAEGAVLIATIVLSKLLPDVGAVGGLTLGADPIVSCTAMLSHLTGSGPVHAFIVRKETKGHGMGAKIEGLGNVPAGTRVAILEDTTTTGASLLLAVEAARAAGLVVVQCLTVVDREEGAAEMLATKGLVLEALVTRSALTLGRTQGTG